MANIPTLLVILNNIEERTHRSQNITLHYNLHESISYYRYMEQR